LSLYGPNHRNCYATLHWSLLGLLNLTKFGENILGVLGQKLGQVLGVLEWEVGEHK
jgi:hypothetical protein